VQEVAGNVDGKIVDMLLLCQRRLQEQTRFAGAAAAELHHGDVIACSRHDVRRMAFEDRAFGACQVVFGQLADALEQFRTDLVIKKATFEPLPGCGKSLCHYSAKGERLEFRWNL